MDLRDPGHEPGLLDYVRVLWRRKYTILIVVLVAVGITVGIDLARPKMYQSSARLLFVSQNYSTGGVIAPLTPTDITTDIGLVQSSTVKALVTKNLKAPAPSVTVAEQGTTEIATVTVTSRSPSFAAKAANAYANAYIAASQQRFLAAQQSAETQLQGQINALQAQINTVQGQINQTDPKNVAAVSSLDSQLGSLTARQNTLTTQLNQVQVNAAQTPSGGQLVEAAAPSVSPVSPKRTTDVVIALLVGLVVGVVLALIRDRLDDRIRTKEELERVVGGLPTLGLIPVVGEWRDRKRPFLISAEHPKSPPAEAYRGLRTSIQFISLDRSIKILQITSPAAADGKTTTAANLAITMAESGQNVVLVGCDLRRPRIHEFFGFPNNVGFTSILVGDVELEGALRTVPDHGSLTILPSGPVPPNPSELLGSMKSREVLARLAREADMVILDSAPVLPVTDAAVIASQVDALLLVASAGTTTRRDVVRACEVLGRVEAPLAGLVLNGASEADCYVYYRYGDQYGYGYRTRSEPRGGSRSNGKGSSPPTKAAAQKGVKADFSNGREDARIVNGEAEKIVRDV